MATEKKKLPMITSPRGTFKFPKLDKPDYGTKEYPAPDGKYETRMVLRADAPETKAFIAKLQPFFVDAVANGEKEFSELKIETRKKLKAVTVNDMFTTMYDRETEQPTGDIEFKFSMKASGIANKGKDNERKWAAKPAVFDSRGQLLKDVPEIWSGSIGKVTFEVSPYFIPATGACGVSLKLKAVQLIELRQGTDRSASEYGFGAEEDGYSHTAAADKVGFSNEDQTDDSKDEIDDEIAF